MSVLSLYVDDILLCLNNNYIVSTIDRFNFSNIRLQFTCEHKVNNSFSCEHKVNNSFSCLKLKIIRNDNRLIDVWYQEPSWSGRYMSNFYFYSRSVKISIISFIDRANCQFLLFFEQFVSRTNILLIASFQF